MAFRSIGAVVAAGVWFVGAMLRAVSADVVRTELAVGLEEPIALDVARDGRVILAERRGAVKVWDPADSRVRTVANLRVFSGPEDGILGLALHPGFGTNGWVFLYHGTIGALENRVSRFTLSGESLDPSSHKILLRVPTLIPKPNHSGGGMAFDAGGNLYIGTGDYTRAGESDGFAPLDQRPDRALNDSQRTAANTADFRGKILRIRPEADGTYTIPSGNLFPPGTAKALPEIYAMGCRNPFRFGVDMRTGRLCWGDVGPDALGPDPQRGPAGFDEFNVTRTAGNFGWPHFSADNRPYRAWDFAAKVAGAAFDPAHPVNESVHNTGLRELPPARPAFLWYPPGPSTRWPSVGSGPRSAMAGPTFHFDAGNTSSRQLPRELDGGTFLYEWERGWIQVAWFDAEDRLVALKPVMPGTKFRRPICLQLGPDGAAYLIEWGSNWSDNRDAALVRLESGLREYDVLRSFPPGRLAVLTANDMPDAQGLTGGNRGVGKWIEAGAQRGSCRAVIAAVVAGDLERADRAWKGIETAFAHQREDGGFEAVVRPTGSSAAEGGAAVETAYFFLQEYGRAVLVIRQSPHEAHFRERIAALEPRLRKACAFLVAGEPTILPKSRKAVNRVFIAAKAFGTCGKVLGDESMVAISRRLVAEALRQRDAEGVFIEHGGRDSSYNAVSILFGEVLGLHVPMPELDAAFPAAARWQASRVLVSGEIDNRGNTRTGVGKEPGYNGQPKGINHGEVTMALTLHGIIHRDPVVAAAADRAFAWMQRESNRTAWVDGTNEVVLDGRNRTVLVDLPEGRKPRAPLLIVFHGFTDSAASIRATTEFASVARQRGWVVAYPEGSRDAKGRTFFQVGYDFHREEKVDDVRAIRELAGRLVRDLDLDARAIFATGFSNGGDLSYYLAAQSEPFVAAVAPVGGTMMSTWGQGLRPAARIPVLAVNMVDDTTTRWAGDPMNRDGWGAYLPVEEVRKAWVGGLGLERSETNGVAGGLRRHRAWTAQDACEVLLYEMPTGGHRWPANLGDPGKTTAAEIVEFFERQFGGRE